MLPGWDRLQDLRRGTPYEPEKPEPTPQTIVDNLTSTEAIDGAADRLVTARVLTGIARDKNMSLLGKLQHLTESAQDFHKRTGDTLDGIAEKIATADRKREEAAAAHHRYYDAIIAGVDESTAVIDRLSNGPLPEGGGS